MVSNCCNCPRGCPAHYASNGTSVGKDYSIQPGLAGPANIYWGCFTAGTYKIKFCGGAFQYYDSSAGAAAGALPNDWVVTRLPANAIDVPQPTGYARYWFLVTYFSGGVQAYANFVDPEQPAWGYATPALAEAAIGDGQEITINHSGGLIGIQFRDNTYTDNTAIEPPFFSLEIPSGSTGTECGGVFTGNVTAVSACGTAVYDTSGIVPQALYTMQFTVNNADAVDYSLYARVEIAGNINWSQCVGPVTVLHSGNTTINVEMTLADISTLNILATLRLMDASGNIKDLSYDLTPQIQIGNILGDTSSPCPGSYSSRLMASWKVLGLPCLKLIGSLDPTSDIDGWGYYDGSGTFVCHSMTQLVLNDVNCTLRNVGPGTSGAGYGKILAHKKAGIGSTVAIKINWQGNGTTLTPGSYTWTGV